MKVVTLNKDAFLKNCNTLLSTIDIQPDIVVGVLNGSYYILNEAQKMYNLKSCNFQFIELKKSIGFKNYFIVRILLRFLPYFILNRLRVCESKKVKKTKNKLDLNALIDYKLDFKWNKIPNNEIKNILIVDDAIDSGKTMFTVKNYLISRFPNSQIKTAVISWTIETSIVKPDFYIFKNVLVRFPWSKDYKGKDFEQKSFSS